MSNPFEISDLVATKTVLGQRKTGEEIVKARYGSVSDVGKKGALVTFDDDVKHPIWCPHNILWFRKIGSDGHVELVKKRPLITAPYVELPEKFPSSPPEPEDVMKSEPPRMPAMPKVTVMSQALAKVTLPPPESPSTAPPAPPTATGGANKIASMVAAGMDPWKIWEEMGRELLVHEDTACAAAEAKLAAAQDEYAAAQKLLYEAQKAIEVAQQELNTLSQRRAEAKRRLET